MKCKALITMLISLSAFGAVAGPCKPVTSQGTQVTSAATEKSTFIDLTTTIPPSETAAESPIFSTIDVSSQSTRDSTAELTTTAAAAETTSENTKTTSDASTTTSEPSTTTTSPPQCPTPTTCDNLGFDWAYYNNPAQNTDTTYSSFSPQSLKQTNPLYVSTTRRIGGLYQPSGNAPSGPIYGSSSDLSLDYFALNHHGFLYTCEAGTYKFDIPYANDAVYLWLGAKAYAGWTSGNADAKALYNQPDHIAGSASFEVNLPESVYIPIRFVYGQAQYGGGFTFKVTTPNGQVIVGNDVEASPHIVRYSCDGASAPAFPAFGSEI
ncbi:hypothetical protein FSPOR_8966 [Fusarium sporotrichioides]|uniref:PA14 domain-containing protein n=1 Tax=Fusarium sporotrichioides TaxID=5514 RepID=A0A395RT21_FUSSP|nr:hypothetical protein FSPOR_8966 [Fusarium sporotrichioides]